MRGHRTRSKRREMNRTSNLSTDLLHAGLKPQVIIFSRRVEKKPHRYIFSHLFRFLSSFKRQKMIKEYLNFHSNVKLWFLELDWMFAELSFICELLYRNLEVHCRHHWVYISKVLSGERKQPEKCPTCRIETSQLSSFVSGDEFTFVFEDI